LNSYLHFWHLESTEFVPKASFLLEPTIKWNKS